MGETVPSTGIECGWEKPCPQWECGWEKPCPQWEWEWEATGKWEGAMLDRPFGERVVDKFVVG